MDAPTLSTDTAADATVLVSGARRAKPVRKPHGKTPDATGGQAEPAQEPASADAEAPAAEPVSKPANAKKPAPRGRTSRRTGAGQPAPAANQEERDQEQNAQGHSTTQGHSGVRGHSAAQGHSATQGHSAEALDESALSGNLIPSGKPVPRDRETAVADTETAAIAASEAADQETTSRQEPARSEKPASPDETARPQEAAGSEQAIPEQADPAAAAAQTADAGKADAEIGDAQITEPHTSDHAHPAPDATPDSAEHKTSEHASESVRAQETPIFAAMFADWDGPAARLISRNLHRADADTTVFDAVTWRPGPEREAPELRLKVGGQRHAPVIIAAGELAAGRVSSLVTALEQILRGRPRQVVVDLAGITAATPGALRALLDVRKVAQAAHVDFWLRSPSQPVRDLLQPAGAPVPARAEAPASRRAPAADAGGGAGPAAEAEAGSDVPSKPQLITAAKLPNKHRRAVAEAKQVLEGVVIDESAPRIRHWWQSHALRESLRKVGSHHHPHGHSASM